MAFFPRTNLAPPVPGSAIPYLRSLPRTRAAARARPSGDRDRWAASARPSGRDDAGAWSGGGPHEPTVIRSRRGCRLSSLITAACLELARDLRRCDFFEAAIFARPFAADRTLYVMSTLALSHFGTPGCGQYGYRAATASAPRRPNGAGGEKRSRLPAQVVSTTHALFARQVQRKEQCRPVTLNVGLRSTKAPPEASVQRR